jgi:hypothetical protein
MTFSTRAVQKKFPISRRAVQRITKISRRAVQRIIPKLGARCSKNDKNRGAQFKAKKYPKAIYWSEFATLFLIMRPKLYRIPTGNYYLFHATDGAALMLDKSSEAYGEKGYKWVTISSTPLPICLKIRFVDYL